MVLTKTYKNDGAVYNGNEDLSEVEHVETLKRGGSVGAEEQRDSLADRLSLP